MAYNVKITCRGTARRAHQPRTVGQFRHGDGWARTHDAYKADDIIMDPSGDMRLRHRLQCDRCTRDDVVTAERLYAALDQARQHGHTLVAVQ